MEQLLTTTTLMASEYDEIHYYQINNNSFYLTYNGQEINEGSVQINESRGSFTTKLIDSIITTDPSTGVSWDIQYGGTFADFKAELPITYLRIKITLQKNIDKCGPGFSFDDFVYFVGRLMEDDRAIGRTGTLVLKICR